MQTIHLAQKIPCQLQAQTLKRSPVSSKAKPQDFNSVWDTAGQQRYKTAIPSIYFKNVQGVVLVYDISDQQSFQRVQEWIKKIQDNCDSTNLVMMLVGNKIDLNEMRQVKQIDAQKFAKLKNMKFRQTSAKQSLNVAQMIEQLMNQVIERNLLIVRQQKQINLGCNKKERQSQSCC